MHFVNIGVMDMENGSLDRKDTFCKIVCFLTENKVAAVSLTSDGKRTVQKRASTVQYTRKRYVTLPWSSFWFLENIEWNIDKISRKVFGCKDILLMGFLETYELQGR